MSKPLIGAIEAGGTKFVLALARADGSVIERTRIATRTGAETLAEARDWFAAGAARHGAIGAFGAASFGPIGIDPAHPDHGVYLSSVKPGWHRVSLPEALVSFDAPLAVDTDVNGAALAEALHGAGRGHDVIAYTTVGTGIGSGVVNRGQVMKGISHYETGHIHVPHDRAVDSFAGVCAYHGDCCEGLASGPAIIERWGHDLSQASEAQVALIGRYLGHLAVALIAFHRPGRLIFGGGVMQAPGLIESLRVQVRTNLAGYLAEWDADLTDRIVAPELGGDAGIVGAVDLGRRILENKS